MSENYRCDSVFDSDINLQRSLLPKEEKDDDLCAFCGKKHRDIHEVASPVIAISRIEFHTTH